jgi:hypothetical protein
MLRSIVYRLSTKVDAVPHRLRSCHARRTYNRTSLREHAGAGYCPSTTATGTSCPRVAIPKRTRRRWLSSSSSEMRLRGAFCQHPRIAERLPCRQAPPTTTVQVSRTKARDKLASVSLTNERAAQLGHRRSRPSRRFDSSDPQNQSRC